MILTVDHLTQYIEAKQHEYDQATKDNLKVLIADNPQFKYWVLFNSVIKGIEQIADILGDNWKDQVVVNHVRETHKLVLVRDQDTVIQLILSDLCEQGHYVKAWLDYHGLTE